MPSYKTLTTDKKNLVLIFTTAHGISVLLINYCSEIGQSYPGFCFDAHMETLRSFTRQYPTFLEDCCEIQPEKWAEANGFEREELTEFETLTLNTLY